MPKARSYKYSPEQIQQAVEKVLNPDTSLTQPGELADAAAVGNALEKIHDDMAAQDPAGKYVPLDRLQTVADAILRQAKESGEFDGDDASVTSENIEAALGYTPASAETVEELSEAIEDLKENGTGGGIKEETDPTVPAWAKEPDKPKYTAQEVGAATKEQFEQVSETLENQQTELDGKQPKGDYALKSEIPVKSVNSKTGEVQLSASDVGARPSTWTPSAEDVGADARGAADSKVTAHNTSGDSHNDIRLLITGLTTRLNALANSTDTDLDQLAEIVAYIKANKSLIDSITTSKVSVADIIDNLTTSVSNKPLSAKMGVQLKALIDAIKIPTTLPASDVYSWAKQPSKPKYTADEVGAATAESVGELSEAIAEQQTAIDGKQPKGNYALSSELSAETTARKQAVADLNARLGQQTLLIAEGETVEEALAWLEANGDKTKAYLMPDDFFYMWRQTTEVGGVAYTNRLQSATDTDRTTIYEGKGYITGNRLSSSGSLAVLDGACVTGFIPVNAGDIVRIKGITPIQTSADSYVITYNSTNAKIAHKVMPKLSDKSDFSSNANTSESYSSYWNYTDGIITITLNTTDFGTGFDAIRFSAGTINENTIVTINEEIKEGGGTVVVEKWASTGHSLTQTDYSKAIAQLINVTDTHTAEINALKEAVENGTTGTDEDPLDLIRGWDAPIYDKTPVFLLDTEKAALTSSDKTVAAVYAKYDALMAANPRYITKTNLGYCSDGVTPVYRYDFCEPESRHQSGFEWSETKPKFIIVTGIHREWNGIYGMFHALSEITTNSELAELRRSVHFIVVPVLSPYSISGEYSVVGHCANYNGVEIHRNFEVGFTVSGEGTIHYTGETALSEVESQYLDNILKNNSDAAYFLTCHSFDRDKTWGVGFLWGSSATKYMCNMAFRVIDKMGRAWHKKYGTTWEEGIARENAVVLSDSTKYPNAKALESGDYRIGHAALTNTGGCEQRQATKYGIQATNFETGETFFVLDQTSLSAKAITHGAEAYINFFLTAMDCYDFKDKKEYFKG